jgi:hypothetical protein
MTRDEMARVAQETVNALSPTLPPGARAVVVVTDAAGTFVGVGRNTSEVDTYHVLFCALYGGDRIDHVRERV